MSSNPYPRDVAVRVLTRVLSDFQPLDESLALISGEVSSEARGWLQEVCSGTLRWKGRLDQALDATALKKKPSGWLRKVLMIAAYQLIVQERTHPGGVVSETVAEVRKKEGEAPAKFANAILRKISEHSKEWRDLALKPRPSKKEGALWASLPDWLWSRLVDQYGLENAKRYAQASLERPSLWIRSKSKEGRVAGDGSAEYQAGPILGSFKIQKSGPILQMAGFNEGEFFVQDISSQTLVQAVSEEIQKSSGIEISALDLCAAPGGKSAGMAWNGLSVTATDRDEARALLLAQTVQRVAPQVKIIPRSEVAGLAPQKLVWVDAPCTGSGILRRHPDVRWLRREKDLVQLTALQLELVREGWDKVSPGGYLAYSVCSVLREEGLAVLQDAGLEAQIVKQWALLPYEEPFGDGFWAALIQRPVI